ncbi:hypothetical protein Q3G72_014298 [Acer saccharum]|nr:hypothetical protein Q3G72_014298 [Acer saccharum]
MDLSDCRKQKTGYGPIQLQKTALLFDLLDTFDPADVVESENPISMESVSQMFGFLLYISEYAGKDYGIGLHIPKVHDRAQVFVSCPSGDNGGRPTYVGTTERWSNQALSLPNARCASNITLYILVENMSRVNYGQYLFDKKILQALIVNVRSDNVRSPITLTFVLGGNLEFYFLFPIPPKVSCLQLFRWENLHGWKMISIPFHNLNEEPKISPIIHAAFSGFTKVSASASKKLEHKSENISKEPPFYAGRFSIDKFRLKIPRSFLQSFGPQCNLYVPASILRHGESIVERSPQEALILKVSNQNKVKLLTDPFLARARTTSGIWSGDPFTANAFSVQFSHPFGEKQSCRRQLINQVSTVISFISGSSFDCVITAAAIDMAVAAALSFTPLAVFIAPAT